MFLFDIAEFERGRKVVVKQNDDLRVSRGIYNTNLNNNAAAKGSYNYETTSGKGNMRGVMNKNKHSIVSATRFLDQDVITNRQKGDVIDEVVSPVYTRKKQTINEKRRTNHRSEKKSIRKSKLESAQLGKQPVSTTVPKTNTVKNKSKLINKYSLGAAGALLGTGAIYGGYKYATRNKKEK